MYSISFFSVIRRSILSHIIVPSLLAGILALSATAQTIRYTDNTVDQTMRGSLNVDPSTLGMSFSLGLGNYPGRGVGMPVTLNYSSKVWRLRFMTSIQGPSSVYTHNMPEFGEHSAAGWTTTVDAPYWEYLPQSYDFNGDPLDTVFACDPTYYVYWVERVILHLPGGVTHELRRSTDAPAERTCTQGAPTLSGTYVAVDGSRIKFEYVSSSEQIVYMPDGSRYVLSSSTAGQYIDRNGNTLTYGSGQWTDTLGRCQ